MKMSRDELARRFAEADKIVVLLRRATLDMQAAGEFVFAERRRELERSRRDGAVRR
jgi:hypothetical protein